MPLRYVYVPLLLLVFGLTGCQSADRLAASQNLAKVGSKSAATMAAYYESLTDIVSRQPELEIFYRTINPTLPKLSRADLDLLDQQRAALQRRAQLARDLQGFYEALQKLAANKTSDAVGKSVDNLTNSLTLITDEPPRLFGADLSATLRPVLSSILAWKQSRDSRRAIVAMQITLNGLERLVNSEKDVYSRIILDRYFALLNGNGSNRGIAQYLLASHSTTIDFLLQQLPELQGLPWSSAPVQDAIVKTAMQTILTNHLLTLELKAKGAAQQVADSLQELTIEHQKLIDGQPLTLATVLGYQAQVQEYIDLWRKFRPRKQTLTVLSN